MTSILLAGGAGFIGSHLSEALLKEGCEVTSIDNFITSSKTNIEKIKSDKFTFIERDISQGVSDIDDSFDYVLNFASPASPPDYLEYPIETLLAGSAGTHALLDLAHRVGSVFMMASTSEVYGDPEIHPQKESYWGNVNSIGPRSCYDEAKRYAESATMAYHRHYGLDVRILRIFNTFGPRMRVSDGRAVSNFICQALRGDDITIYGDGSQTRSFCYVTDLVEGIIKLMRSSVSEPVNLGNPQEMSILDLAKTIIEFTGSGSKIRHEGLPEDDPKLRKPDITRANELLGWSPRVRLADGLLNTIEYYKTTLNL